MKILEDYHSDVLMELLNIGVGKAAGVLNEMVGAEVTLQVPDLHIVDKKNLNQFFKNDMPEQISAVRLDFSGHFDGVACIAFPKESASNLVAGLTGEKPGTIDMDSTKVGTLLEIGNIVISGVMGSIGNMLEIELDFSVPIYLEDKIERIIGNSNNDSSIVIARMNFTVEALEISGHIIMLFELASFENFITSIGNLK